MVPFIAPCADAIAGQVATWPIKPRKVLDIAAGHGLFEIAIAKALPKATIAAVDWESVLAVARGNAEEAGIVDRYRTIAGSAFDVDWGKGYDLALLPNFLHHFDYATCVALLKKVRQSLTSKGKTLAVEFVPNEDRISPYVPAVFAFHMLAFTPGGDAFTATDLNSMARDAGFRSATVTSIAGSPKIFWSAWSNKRRKLIRDGQTVAGRPLLPTTEAPTSLGQEHLGLGFVPLGLASFTY